MLRPYRLLALLALLGCERPQLAEHDPTPVRAAQRAPAPSVRSAAAASAVTSARSAGPPSPAATTARSAEPPNPAGTSARPAAPPIPAAAALVVQGGAKAVSGRGGMVSSVEAQATRAGVDVLRAGGNAVDAAVAVAAALAVTHPSAGNLGGGGFMLVKQSNSKTVAIDFRETAPGALTRANFDVMIRAGARGPVAVGIPGSPAGLLLAHERYGKLSRRAVFEPAIQLARSGYVLGARQAQVLRWSWNALKSDPSAAALFARSGRPATAGSVLHNPELADVIERIAQAGHQGFYGGVTAQRLLEALGPAGVTQDDLSGYRAIEREPIRFGYRGFTVEVMPPPSAGGVTLQQLLGMLEQLGAHRFAAGSAEELHLLAEASRRAQIVRRLAVRDPDSLSARELQDKYAQFADSAATLRNAPVDIDHATASAQIHPDYPALARELEHTTHFSVVDGAGTAVSCTMTLSASFGAKLIAPGTGLFLNNSVASFSTSGVNLPVGGRRTISSMAPTLVLQDGRVVLVLGTPGGDTIPSTIAQVLRRIVDHRATLADAIDAPRVHHGFVPDELRYERDRPPAKHVLTRLRRMGHKLVAPRAAIGDANNIAIAADVLYGYADPREGGLALALEPR